MEDEDTIKEFNRRKWAFLRDVDVAYKAIEEEKAKPAGQQLEPPSLLDKWDAYLADLKAVCIAAATSEDLPPKIERVSKLEPLMDEHWPASNHLSDLLLAVEDQWGVFR